MGEIIEHLLTCWVDPFLLFKSMSTLGVRRSKKQYKIMFVLLCALIVLKGILISYVDKPYVNGICTFVIFTSQLVLTIYLFDGKLYEKVIHIIMFICIIIVTEIVIMELGISFTKKSYEELVSYGTTERIAFVVAKTIQALLCYMFFGSKKVIGFFYKNKYILSFLLAISVLGGNLVIKSIVYKESKVIIFAEVLMYLMLCFIFSSVAALKKKDENISLLKKETEHVGGQEQEKKKLDQFKHDYSANAYIMKNLCYYKEYEKLEEYMDKTWTGSSTVDWLIEHSNVAVRIVLSSLIQTARKVGIPLSIKIEVEEYGMSDEDICIIFQKLVLNGLELAAETADKNAYVKMNVIPIEDGFRIECLNTCEGTEEEIEKKLLENMNLQLVQRILNRYDGTLEKTYETDNMLKVIVAVRNM